LIEEERIVLLELNPAGDPGSTVGRILEFSLKLGIQLRHESVGAFQPTLHHSELCGIPPCFNPDVIFLVLYPSHLKQAGALLQSMGREPLELPVIAVIEESKPDQMLTLLKLEDGYTMAKPPRIEYEGAFYLINTRGNEKRTGRLLKEQWKSHSLYSTMCFVGWEGGDNGGRS